MNQELKKEIEKFKIWSKNYSEIPESERLGEWECLYDDWDILGDLFIEFIETITHVKWSEEDVKLVLYLVARDNECETFIDEISEKQPNSLELLANKSFEFGEKDAKWQIATRLDKLENKEVAKLLLEKFMNDDNEYVRRRASIKMGEL
ncbi:MAG: hypothetical protein KGV59_02385 [Tenacibaculum sp.]|nr:hypothetical protein [Tenacibaculum sp.]